MRSRHVPRVCRSCHAPFASDEGACWRCGIEWASAAEPPTTLRLVAGGADTQIADGERWTNEGGSFGSEVTAPHPAVAAGG